MNNPSHFCLDKMTTTGPAFGTIGGGAGNDILVCDIYPFGSIISEDDCESRSNVSPIVLDVKYNDGSGDTCVYGNVYVDPGVRLVYDMHPWASEFYQYAGETEMITDWPDPDYRQSPGGMWHDWNGMEGEIMIFDLSELLLGNNGDKITDVRVRITDDTPMGYKGNWQRSGNVLDQLNNSNNRAIAGFINDNPYDDDVNWKICKYSGCTDDIETSFIYNRNKDGLNDGKVRLDYFIMVEYYGHPDPRNIYKPINLRFSSTETKYPNNCATYIDIKAFPIFNNDIILSQLPGGYTRLNQIFKPVTNCPVYFHTQLVISDSDITNENVNILYVSSNDNLLDNQSRIDSTIALGFDDTFYQAQHHFNFGVRRGKGSGLVSIQDKIWYSCDEMIVNGGFEIINAEILDLHLNVLNYNDVFRNVLVQSQSDIVLIMSHSEGFITNNNSCHPAPIICDLSIPRYWGLHQDYHEKFSRYVSYYESNNPSCVDNYLCSDYGTLYSHPILGHSHGDFWLKIGGECRWLALWSCSQMSRLGPYKPMYHWLSTIQNGYSDSVTGFRYTIKPHLYVDKLFFSQYSSKLYRLLIDNNYNYNPDEYVFTNSSIWEDSSVHYTRDISVAAWMEASVITASKYDSKKKRYIGINREFAEAIDYDHVDNCYYNWRLQSCETYGSFLAPKYRYKIKRYVIN